MPYHYITDLPEAQTDQYNIHQKEAFLKAFNNAYEEYGHDEEPGFCRRAPRGQSSAGAKAGEEVRGTTSSNRR